MRKSSYTDGVTIWCKHGAGPEDPYCARFRLAHPDRITYVAALCEPHVTHILYSETWQRGWSQFTREGAARRARMTVEAAARLAGWL